MADRVRDGFQKLFTRKMGLFPPERDFSPKKVCTPSDSRVGCKVTSA